MYQLLQSVFVFIGSCNLENSNVIIVSKWLILTLVQTIERNVAVIKQRLSPKKL